MSTSTVQNLLSAITSTKGALLTAPVLVGVGLLLSLADSGSRQTATAETKPVTAAVKVQDQGTPAAADAKVVKTSSLPSQSSAFTPEQRAEIGKLVREYLLANPEILQEVGEELAQRQRIAQDKARIKVLASSKDEIFRSPIDFAVGDDDADVTIVEYFDYNCGWCKRALTEVIKLTDADKKVRVVLKEFPIFGEHSEFAARAALASKPQGKYWDFHIAMMKERRVTKDNVLQIAERVGIDVEKLKVEMAKPKYAEAIQKTQQIATSLGIEGTPGFIVDDKVSPGYVPSEQLKAMVADVRKNGCKIC